MLILSLLAALAWADDPPLAIPADGEGTDVIEAPAEDPRLANADRAASLRLWDHQLQTLPIVNLSALWNGGRFIPQLVGGGELAFTSWRRGLPVWRFRSSLRGVVTYGVGTRSGGGEIHISHLAGPSWRFVEISTGPDLWADGYGYPGAPDLYLPWTPGLSWWGRVIVRPVPILRLVAAAAPGWVFLSTRQAAGLGPFHELTVLGAVGIDLQIVDLTVGWQRRYTSAGALDGILVSLSL